MNNFKIWQHPSAGLFQCQTCGSIVPLDRNEDKLSKHSAKHKENK